MTMDTFVDKVVKPVGILGGTISTLFALLYATGLAPVTNSAAKQMVLEQTQSLAQEIKREYVAQNSLDELKHSQQDTTERIKRLEGLTNDINGSVNRLDERSKGTAESNKQILDAIKNLNKDR